MTKPAIVAALLSLCAGCSPPADAEDEPCVMEPCAIADDACQLDVFEAIACAREYDGPSPPVDVISSDDYFSRVEEASQPPTVADAQINAAFVALGLVPPSETGGTAQGTPIAYYSSTEGRVTIVETDAEPESQVFALLQVFARAQQDVEYDLDGLYARGRTYDESLATSALTSGEAYFSATLAFLHGRPDAPEAVSWAQDEAGRARDLAADGLASFEGANAAFTWGYGGLLFGRRWNRHDRVDIETIFSDPPRSTLAVVSLDPPGFSAPDLPDPFIVAPASYSVLAVDAMGAWVTNTFIQRVGGPDILDSWRGDEITIVAGEGSDDIGIHWRIELSGFGAHEIAAELEPATSLKPWFVTSRAGTLIVVVAPTSADLPQWIEWFGLEQ